MIQTVNFSDFVDQFRALGREDQFTYEAKRLLFDYLEELEKSTGEPIEFSVIGICCDFSQDDVESIAESHDIDVTECEDDNERQEKVIEYLQEHTSVVGTTTAGGIVYQQF